MFFFSQSITIWLQMRIETSTAWVCIRSWKYNGQQLEWKSLWERYGNNYIMEIYDVSEHLCLLVASYSNISMCRRRFANPAVLQNACLFRRVAELALCRHGCSTRLKIQTFCKTAGSATRLRHIHASRERTAEEEKQESKKKRVRERPS